MSEKFEEKKQLVRRLLSYLEVEMFEDPRGPYSSRITELVAARMREPSRLVKRDIVVIQLSLKDTDTITIHTAQESHHNGDEWDKYQEKIPVFEEFLDYAIAILRNRVSEKVRLEIERENEEALRARIQLKMRIAGLL